MAKRRKSTPEVSHDSLDERLILLESQRLAHIGSWEWDIEEDAVRWSDELFRIYGIVPWEFGGNYDAVLERIHPDDRDALRDLVQRSLETHRPFELQHRICRPNGSVRTVRAHGAILTSRSGAPAKMIGTAQDVTDQVKADEERRIMEAQLRNAQKMEALGQLASGIAHDFNNLLVGIRGNCELLLPRLEENTPEARIARQIHQASNQAALLTQQLLAFSRTQIVEPSVVSLNDIVTNLEELLQRTLGEDVELVKILAPELWNVKADPGQIGQVIVNLAVNARDAMPNGGRLTIETQNVQFFGSVKDEGICPGAYVRLTVTDNGSGMDAETRARIFEPFFTTKPIGKGTGLGLATVYGIVKQNGGQIRAESALHRGTAFEIFLPRSTEASRCEDLSPSQAIRGGNETILVVEDDQRAREVTCAFLQGMGYEVLEAENGIQALRFCERFRRCLHLIVADVIMPRMSGPRLLRRARMIRQDFKVLFISGYPDSAEQMNGNGISGVTFLKKPFTQQAIAEKVREALSSGNQEPAKAERPR